VSVEHPRISGTAVLAGPEVGASAAVQREPAWYAVYTRGRHEKKVASGLTGKSVQVFLPLATMRSRRRDRFKMVDVPLFAGYVFVNSPMSPADQLGILKTKGVVRIVGTGGIPEPIPDAQIHSLQVLVESGAPLLMLRAIPRGSMVTITEGPFQGVVGKVLRLNEQKQRLVVSIDLLQRSVSVEIDESFLEKVG
jgi:transcription antitermination factor NusG